MDGAPIDLAMSLRTDSLNVAREVGTRLDAETARLDRKIVGRQRQNLIPHLRLYADVCRRDAHQRLIHDLHDWRPLPDDDRRERLDARAVHCEIFAELNRIAAERGPDAEYDDGIDAQLRARKFSDLQRAKIRRLLEKGFAREAYTPGSLAAFVPSEDLLRKMTEECGEGGSLEEAMRWTSEVREATEISSHINYRRAITDPNFINEFGLEMPVRRRFGDQIFPAAPYVNSDAIERAFLPQYMKDDFDLEKIGDDDFVVPQVFHESDLPDMEIEDARARRALRNSEAIRAPEPTGRTDIRPSCSADVHESADEHMVDTRPPPSVAPDSDADMIASGMSTAALRSSVATEIAAALGQIVKETILPELRRNGMAHTPPAEITPSAAGIIAARDGDDQPVTGAPLCGEMAATSKARTPLTKFFERFATTKGTWDAKTLSQARQTTELFVRVTKAENVETIRPDHILIFREALERLPKSYGKSPEDRVLSIETILDRSSNATAGAGLSAKTINRHFSHFFALLEYAVAGGFVTLDIDKLRKAVRARKNGTDDDPRVAFTRKDLDAIFSYATWTMRGRVVSSHDYWIPLLGYYTSARLSEICCLRIMDIDVEARMIDITPHEARRLKNRSSKRLVPIHPELIRLGFLDFVGSRKQRPEGLLFSELKGNRQNDNLGALFSKDWSNLLPKIVPLAREEKKSFHSFRHTANTLLGERGITEDFRNQILGHSGKTTNARVYTHTYDRQFIREAIEKIPSVTSHLVPKDWSAWRPPSTRLNSLRATARAANGASDKTISTPNSSATRAPVSGQQPMRRRGRPRKETKQ